MSIAYYNGKLLDFSEIKIPLTDRCIFFGDGIYDAAIGRGGKIYLCSEHIKRFLSNARRIGIPFSMKKENLAELLHMMAKNCGHEEYFIYFQLSRFSPERTHSYPDTEKHNLLITVKENILPPMDKMLRLYTTEDIRYLMCDVKTLNLLPAVLASRAALDRGCDEAVFKRGAIITECAHSNIAIVKNGIFITHPEGRYILPGITRKRILALCDRMGIVYKEVPFTHEEMLSADEVLVMSTTKLCLAADRIDGKLLKSTKSGAGRRIIEAIREDFWRSTE